MKGKIAIGAIVGAVAGVAAGLLTAPKSGKETRADIKAKADELKNQAEKTSRQVKDSANDMKVKATDKVQGVVNETKQKFTK